MKHLYTFFCLFALTVSFVQISSSKAVAQDLNSAYFIENYAYSYRLNPAFTTKKNFVGGLLSNVNTGTNGNIGISTLFYPYEGELATFMHKSVDREEFLKKIHHCNELNVNASVNFASTGFWTKLKGKDIFQTFEINMRNNTSTNLPYNLFSFLKGGDDSFFYDLSNVSAYTRTFVEMASGTAAKFGKLEVGARAKFLVGTNKINVDIKEMYANLDATQWTLSSTATYTAAGAGIKRKTKKSVSGDYDVIDFSAFKFRTLGVGGLGAALDFGVRYKVNDYINFSAAVNDFGVIVWRNKVNGVNDKTSWIVSVDDIKIDDVGGLVDVLENIIKTVRSINEFVAAEKNYTTQSLSLRVNVGAEFKMPFYKQMSIGLLGSFHNSNINSYNEFRVSLNAMPLNWLSLSVNSAYTTYGWQVGGMVNIYAKKFSCFVGTDSYYYRMTPQLLPVNNFNTHYVFGVNFLLTRNPWVKSGRRER